MKVLQVVKTNRGATWAYNQAKYIHDKGIEIITIMPNASEGVAKKYAENGMTVVASDWSLPITKPWKIIARSKAIRRIVKDIRPDIIHMHFVTNVLMCRIALRHDKTPRLFQVPGPLHLENRVTSFVERKLATKVDYWAGGCKKTCEIYKNNGIPEDRIFLAYYGIPQKTENQVCVRGKLREKYGIADDQFVIGMVSYFYRPKRYLGYSRGIKGHEDFIEALKIVMHKKKNVVPVIIGSAWDGGTDYETTVKQYAKDILGDRVIFTGYRDDVYEIYKDISVAVHPSHSENLGGAAESLMLEVPTVSTDVGGFPDIVIPEKTGCLAKVKNPQDLAEKIIWMIEHYDEAMNMATNGREYVDKLLDLNNTTNTVINIYGQIEKTAVNRNRR